MAEQTRLDTNQINYWMRLLKSHLDENYLTPEMFGALGDGISDDSAAINQALQTARTMGIGQVMLVSKVYRGDNILIPPMVKLKGKGVTHTTIKARDGWTGLGVIITEGFQAYMEAYLSWQPNTSVDLTIHKGSYGASIEDINIDANYDSFGGTPARFSGLGLAIAGAFTLHRVECKFVPSVGYVHVNLAGSPNFPPAYWDKDKGQNAVNTNSDICIKHCGNDCAFIANADSIYHDIIAGFAARGVGTRVDSFYSTRSCSMWHFTESCNIIKAHAYAYGGGFGYVFGKDNYGFYPSIIRYTDLVAETVSNPAWFRPSCSVQGGKMDAHNFSMNQSHPEISLYGTYTPGIIIQSGLAVTGLSERRLTSNYGIINIQNSTISSTNPDVNFEGTHVVVAGENNKVELNMHRSPYFQPALGGIGVMLAGINNKVTGQIVGFLGDASDGGLSCGIQVQPASRTDVDLVLRRCNLGLRWTTNSNQPNLTGRIKFEEGVTTYVDYYINNASLQQRNRLELITPNGSNHMSAVSSPDVIDVSNDQNQIINISGFTLPYVPSRAEVSCNVATEQAETQARYIQVQYAEYRPELSTVNNLVFVVRVIPINQSSRGASLRCRVN